MGHEHLISTSLQHASRFPVRKAVAAPLPSHSDAAPWMHIGSPLLVQQNLQEERMKLAITAALLTLVIGSPAFAFQEPDKDKDKPPKQEEPRKQEPAHQQAPKEKQPQDRPEEKQPPRDTKQDHQQTDRSQAEKQQQQQNQKQQQQAAKQQQQNEKQQQQATKQQQQNEKDRAKQDHAQQEQRARDEHNVQQAQHDARARDEHNNAQQAQRDGGNHNGRRIREEDFRAHFGREHHFRVSRSNDRRFNYGGYWFVYSDPWPAGWSYDDDVYVDEIDGEYYLIDSIHPGIRILVIVQD
jgi:hypothetical protein